MDQNCLLSVRTRLLYLRALVKSTAFLVIGFFILFSVKAQPVSKIKITCIGASITYGANLSNREENCYPAQLQRMLGPGYVVANYGVSGTTLLKKGNQPYWKTTQYREALTSRPDMVLIDLGGNDSKLINRKYFAGFESDMHGLIRSFAQLPSHPRIILLLAMPSFAKDTSGIWDPVIVKQVNPHIQNAAYNDGVEVIDMHSPFVDKENHMPDKIHPDAEGTVLMAKTIYDVLATKRNSSFNIFNSIKDKKFTFQSFYGYPCADFIFEGHDCKIVKPRLAAKGHPWVWRARFWGHEPQTDIALLERGYHIVYCDAAELFGNDEAIQLWNHYYSLLRKAGLSKKAVLEGMSRGGVYSLNWAAVNPGKVAAVYIDNPVLDLKSWPAGLGREPRSQPEFEAFIKDFHLSDSEQVKNFAGSPIDKIPQIVRGNYPILILCADADEAVPPEENTVLFEQKIRDSKGQVTVIHKPGFHHHPHSLPNPAPIIDFIVKASADINK
ncbi:MAG: GDSL-type esterase/lipase family protein [Ginsengibacter sp.]